MEKTEAENEGKGSEMDILEYLKERHNELERVNHPFADRSIGFRYLYAYGIGVMALGSMKSITELSDQFQFFLECLALPKEQRDKILVDLNNNFEFRLSETIKVLRTKEVQYCFMLDLYQLYSLAVWSEEYCDKVMENYRQIFHMSEAEISFFGRFHEAVMKKDVLYAGTLYREFRKSGFDIRYKTLKYFFPEFKESDTYKDITVALGKTMLIDKPTTIKGDIRVERGASLLFTDADVVIEGSIYVDGGRVRISHSTIQVSACEKEFFLELKDVAVMQIEYSTIDCKNSCGFLKQNSGRLLAHETEFWHSANARMIEFTGTHARFLNCSFIKAELGFLFASAAASLEITHCDFSDSEAEYGAAILSDSIGNVLVKESSFRRCKAKYLGAAIYFKYQKLGQVVRDCVCGMCEPEGNEFFNRYEDDFILKIR